MPSLAGVGCKVNMSPVSVLFVSKPVVEPFNDGSKCLVRDIAGALTRYEPTLMVAQGEVRDSRGKVAPVYTKQSAYQPALLQNLRVLNWLMLRAREDIWHFVFAPNRRTSQAARLLKNLRRVPVLQTIASQPRSFDAPRELLFGDIIVAQSEWTRQQFLAAFDPVASRPAIHVIAPAVPHLAVPSRERQLAMRKQLDLPPEVPIVLYPGDLEVSHGAEWVARAVQPICASTPNACVVFAYRHKSAAAAEQAHRWQAELPGASTRFIAEVSDMHALLSTSSVVLFPVDNLYGKVDIPIVLLEAMHFGVPVVALDSGPLADLVGNLRVPGGDISRMVEGCSALLKNSDFRAACVAAQLESIERIHRPAQVASRYEALYDELAARFRVS